MWIVLAVLAVVVLMQVVGSGGGYKTVDTGVVVNAIDTNRADNAQLTTGDDNSIKVQLTAKSKSQRNEQYGEVRWAVTITNQADEIVATYELLTMNAV